MEKQTGVWCDEEVKALFKFVEVKKSEGVPLVKIFDVYANLVKRQKNSVRNYYYKEIKELSANNDRRARLNINLKNHFAKFNKPFKKEDTQRIIGKIDSLVSKGYSVRGACLNLAGGDASLMIRYQNKYRTEVKHKRENDMGNVIKMPTNPNVMSDEDINALFLGLIKLVKRQEKDKAKFYYQVELETANDKLKSALKEIVLKKAQIEKLQSEIGLLKSKVEELKEKEIIRNVNLIGEKTAKDAIADFVKKKNKTKQVLNV